VFSFEVAGHAVTLFGNQFCYRTAERSARKFKSKPTVEL
jgi:hypothetical protein